MKHLTAIMLAKLPKQTIMAAVLLLAATLRVTAGGERGDELARSNRGEPVRFPIHQSDSDPDRFGFETEKMRGTIRLDGAYHGITALVDLGTGREVIDARYSALNLFRLMSVNRVMGMPRAMQRTTTSTPAGVEVKWTATETHQGEITARYEVVSSNAIDVTVTVESRATYAGYELFLSSYFDKAFQPHVYLRPARNEMPTDDIVSRPIVPTINDVFRGTLLVFPRDPHAARLSLDGRWDQSEIQLCPVRHYAHCLALLTDPGKKLGVVLMAHPRDCFAFSTRYHADKDEDRLTTYSAFDFSLFGNDLLPGDRRVVKVRLALTELDEKMSQPLELYGKFVSEWDRMRNSIDERWDTK